MYVSLDIESDGPVPGQNSMLSLGAAAFHRQTHVLIDTFEVNLVQLAGATPNPATMEWWKTQPEAWAVCRAGAVAPFRAMDLFGVWLKQLPATELLAICYPASFDFPFVKYYWHEFMGDDC